jgi:hypothetical protein
MRTRQEIEESLKTKRAHVFACEHGASWYDIDGTLFGDDKCDRVELYNLIPHENDLACIECGAAKGERHTWPCTREVCPHCSVHPRIGCINRKDHELTELLFKMRDMRA